MKKSIGKKYSSVIQVAIFMLCINSVCMAVVVEFTDVNDFINVAGDPQYFIDFETDGYGNPVNDLPTYPDISGNEWSNLGIEFAAIEVGIDLFLYNDPGSKEHYVSPTHTLMPRHDISSILITFSTPVVSFGVYLLDNETGGPDAYPAERITLKDENDNILGDFDMPYDPSQPTPPIAIFFRGYLSDTPIAQVHIIEDLDGESMSLDNVMYVPEPATLLLFGLGGLALRRKCRAK